MRNPLRICVDCGLKAETEKELKNFHKDKRAKYGHGNLCLKCHAKRVREHLRRTAEFVEIFKERSIDGIVRCYFCNKEITEFEGNEKESLVIHSLDENHENWDPENKAPTHRGCHLRWHNTGERNPRSKRRRKK